MSVRTLPVVHGETNSFVHLSLTIFSLSSNWVLAAVVVIGSLGLTVGEPFLPESGPQLYDGDVTISDTLGVASFEGASVEMKDDCSVVEE